MDIAALAAELTADTLARGYSGMSDAAAATDLNTVYRERNRTSMTGSEVLNAVDAEDWGVLSDADIQSVWNVCHLGNINPFGIEATLLTQVFGVGSDTIVALIAARKEPVSRAVELKLGHVGVGNVVEARK